jgi:AcrR family transcriptional regulator
MPPKMSFTKERILDCAFDIIRKDGLGALSARRIAQELKCSTRPVYGTFVSMAALQAAVIQKAREFALNFFLVERQDSDTPFLSLGLRYFQFSQEERSLFTLLYMEGKMGGSFENLGRHFAPLLDRMKTDPCISGLSEVALKRLGTNSWIYTHGLIALIHAFKPDDAEELIRKFISQMGLVLCEWEQHHATQVQTS